MKIMNIVSAVAVMAAVIGFRMGTKATWESEEQRKRSEGTAQI